MLIIYIISAYLYFVIVATNVKPLKLEIKDFSYNGMQFLRNKVLSLIYRTTTLKLSSTINNISRYMQYKP